MDSEIMEVIDTSININEILPGWLEVSSHESSSRADDGCADERTYHTLGRDVMLDRAQEIVDEMENGIAQKDYHLRTRIAAHSLKRHLDLKRSITREACSKAVKLLYAVITDTQDLDQILIRNFAKLACRILQRKDLQPLSISLPWFPLYRLMDLFFFGKARTPQIPLCRNLGHYLVSLARHSRRYFDASCNPEIFKEFRPMCCPQDMSVLKSQAFLALLIRRDLPDALDYLEEMLSMWSWIVTYSDWDLHWLQAIASICRHTYKEHASRWIKHIPLIYAHVLHLLDIPVGPSRIRLYENKESSISYNDGYPMCSLSVFVHKGETRSKSLQIVNKAAKLLIYLMYPREGFDNCSDIEHDPMTYLRRLAKGIETFLHPSNGGYWTRRLSQLIASLCEHLFDRVTNERMDETDQKFALKKSDISEFVDIIKPLAFQGLYSKSSTTVMHSCTALKMLSLLDADATLPPLLDRLYQALTTLTEVHQTSAALDALSAVIHPTLQIQNFSAGIGHIPSLLNLTLTGIDTNDMRKTWSTLRFYTILLSGLPLIPITDEAPPPGLDLTRHEEARQTTDMLMDWALRFLDQTFVFILHQGAHAHGEADVGNVNKGDSESRTSEYLFQCALEVFFMQMGESLYDSAVNKVANFCFTNLLSHQQGQLGVLLTAITAVNPTLVVRKFVPICLRILLESPKWTPKSHRAARTPSMTSPSDLRSPGAQWSPSRWKGQLERQSSSSDQEPFSIQDDFTLPSHYDEMGPFRLAALSDTELIYYMSILRHIIVDAGCEVLVFRRQIEAVIELGLKVEERPGVKSRKVVKAALHLLRCLLQSLVTFRPKDCRSVPSEVWNDPVWRRSHYVSWGEALYLKDVKLEWRRPSKEGLQWAADLASNFLREPTSKISNFVRERERPVSQFSSDAEMNSPASNNANSASEGSDSSQKDSRPLFTRVAPEPLNIPNGSKEHRSSDSINSVEALYCVNQIRFVLQGLVTVLPKWEGDSEDCPSMDGIDSNDVNHVDFKVKQMAEIIDDSIPDSVTLPPPCEAENHLNRFEIARLLHEITSVALKAKSEDVKLLKGLAKAIDVALNGVDILQKLINRLRLRYTILKSQHREQTIQSTIDKKFPRYTMVAKVQHHHMYVIMQRQRKCKASNLVLELTKQICVLATFPYKVVRSKGQPALLSCVRRHEGACALIIPYLISVLEDRLEVGTAQEQRVLGAAHVLQTKCFQNRLLRDWGVLRRFILALCRANHLDKLVVHAALVDVFNSVHSALYQMSLDLPIYSKWIEASPAAETNDSSSSLALYQGWSFEGHGEMLEALVALLDGKTKTHWRYRLMIVHTISTLLRDDVAPPLILWNVVLDELVSDVSHVRKVCLRAFNTMLQQLQTEQQSKVELFEEHDRFPDKNFSNWNGMPPRKRINDHLTQARRKVITEAYKLEVVEMLKNRFKTSSYVESIIKCLSVIQAARAKSFVGSFAQMWKGLFKFVGMDVLHAMEPFLDGVIGDPQAYTKLSTDVYLGQQCLAAEIVGGLIRGSKYWTDAAKEVAQDKICKVLEVILNIPEMESASTWSSCLRFSIFDRHPRRVSWLISFLFDSALPSCSNESSRNSVLFCRRIAILRPILNELSWRGVPLHRQLIHDLEPYLESPYSQTRDAASSCVGLITRVTWNPPWKSANDRGDEGKGDEGSSRGHEGESSSQPTATRPPVPMEFTTKEPLWPSECMHGLISRLCTKICKKGMTVRAQQLKRRSQDDDKVDENFDDLLTELKNLRHALIRLVLAVCPHFDGMYSCPLAPHLPAVLPPLLQALEDRDKDISRQAKHCAELAANTPMLCRNILPLLLSSVYSVGKSTSWHVRAAMLPFLQIVTFRHQFLINEEDFWNIRELMVFLLQDSQVEVRETACSAISVLVRMSGEETALELKQSFYLWADSKIPTASQATKTDGGSAVSDALLKRHAGVLGLAALVGAYPYDVPEWMPEVLVRLATHVLDPMPIRQTVRKIFGEFWRTHQDSWPVLKCKFDEQQLSTLTNLLVAPTYFS